MCAAARRFGWRRFGLRSLFAVVTILAVALAFWLVPAFRQTTAVDIVRKAGGEPGYGPSEHPKLDAAAPDWVRALAGDDVEALWIKDKDLRDNHALAHLAELPDIKSISIRNCQFEAEDLRGLTPAKGLKNLFLYDSTVADAHLSVIGSFKQVEKLGLARTQITDQGIAHLANLAELRYISLNGNRIADESVPHLAKLKRLEEIELFETDFSNDGIKRLKEALPNCKIVP